MIKNNSNILCLHGPGTKQAEAYIYLSFSYTTVCQEISKYLHKGSDNRLRLASFGHATRVRQFPSVQTPGLTSCLRPCQPGACHEGVPLVTFLRSPAASSELSLLSEERPSPGSLTCSLGGSPPLRIQLAMVTGRYQRPEGSGKKTTAKGRSF